MALSHLNWRKEMIKKTSDKSTVTEKELRNGVLIVMGPVVALVILLVFLLWLGGRDTDAPGELTTRSSAAPTSTVTSRADHDEF